jgi:hypothetical protein
LSGPLVKLHGGGRGTTLLFLRLLVHDRLWALLMLRMMVGVMHGLFVLVLLLLVMVLLLLLFILQDLLVCNDLVRKLFGGCLDQKQLTRLAIRGTDVGHGALDVIADYRVC